MEKHYQLGSEYAEKMDNNDKLGHFKNRFYLNKGEIYLCGNSMGLASKDAEEGIIMMIEKWKKEGVKLWVVDNGKCYLYSSHIAALMAPLIGADKEEIAVGTNTTTNIHQGISTLYKPTKDKYKILVDDINFPTDRYAVDGQVRLKGYDPKDAVKIVKSDNEKFLDEDKIIEAMTPEVALVLLSTVYYKTSQLLDMKKITDAAKKRDIIIGWDLSHAVGAVEIDLKSLDADFAVWCSYKYLNGGPGCPAMMYCNRKHFDKTPGLPGWYGNKRDTQFLLLQDFEHQQDASGWQTGSPSILSMSGLEGSLKIFLEAGMSNVRKKSLHLTGYMMYLIEEKLSKYGFKIGNYKEDSKRGGHVCLEHDEGYRISIDLKKRGVVPDFRDPNMIRLTPTGLYNSYKEVYDAVEILLDIVETESYKKIDPKRQLVY
jgi:kynureninase